MYSNKNILGITEIGIYIPDSVISNYDKKVKFDINDAFINDKIGIEFTTRKSLSEDTSDMCVKAYKDLQKKNNIIDEKIECIIVVTQNPDSYGLPHTSAIVHKKLGLKNECAAFDISLGCSGFVYGLSVIKSFMESNAMENGLLFTCDPYSKIVNEEDKNTSLLFGDAATVTLISSKPKLLPLSFLFGTKGSESDALFCKNNVLFMDGRAVFNFSAIEVPIQINKLLENNNLFIDEIDLFILHQGSKYIVDTLKKRLGVEDFKVPTNLKKIGNTVSSSIPLLLSNFLDEDNFKKIILSGFGVGLSWASVLIERQTKNNYLK